MIKKIKIMKTYFLFKMVGYKWEIQTMYMCPIHTSKTCLAKPGLTEWKSAKEKWKTEFDIAAFK